MSCKKPEIKALQARGEETHLDLSNNDLLYQLALPELNQIRSVEGACNFTPSDRRQPLHALKVDDDNPFFSEEDLG